MEQLELYLKPLYGKKAKYIAKKLSAHVQKMREEKNVLPPITGYWYKFNNIYAVYPDAVAYKKNISPLKNIKMHIKYVKQLGCNAMHILPFLDSPMIDRGFDISDFYKVRPSLGTMQDIKAIKKEAEKLGMPLFMDLVFNHVSEKHEWSQKAESGDSYYRDFFYWRKEKPDFIGIEKKESSVIAKYKEQGKTVTAEIAFPESVGEIPHWRQGKDGYWYYHTYYPQQPDINWFNPEVFIEMAKVVLYWANFGFNFRLDAIPFVGEPVYKNASESNPNTHTIIAALKYIAWQIHPQTTFVVESYENLDAVIDYFGTANKPEADLSYNFYLCTNIWVSLVKRESKFIWQELEKLDNIPKHAEWINFLRNHDELSLAHLDKNLIKEVKEKILKYGKPFRSGFGIAGRTFSLLGEKRKQFFMSYFLLASFPGAMLITYGDEFAFKNIPIKTLSKSLQGDTRNINRGTITKSNLTYKEERHAFKTLSKVFKKRLELRAYLNVWPQKIDSDKEVFAAKYTLGSSELLIFINLCDKKREIKIPRDGYKKISYINNVYKKNPHIILGPYAGIWLQR